MKILEKLKELRHPNIISVVEICDTGQCINLVLELASHKLSDAIHSHKHRGPGAQRLPPAAVGHQNAGEDRTRRSWELVFVSLLGSLALFEIFRLLLRLLYCCISTASIDKSTIGFHNCSAENFQDLPRFTR